MCVVSALGTMGVQRKGVQCGPEGELAETAREGAELTAEHPL